MARTAAPRARRPDRKQPAFMRHAEHQRLWKIVEGAVVDAFASHSDYLTGRGRRLAVGSITKRVVGQLVGHAKETLAGGRLGGCCPDGVLTATGRSDPAPRQGGGGARKNDARPEAGEIGP